MSCPGPPLTFLDSQGAPVPRDAPAVQTRQPSLPPVLHIPLLTGLTDASLLFGVQPQSTPWAW